MYHRRNILLEQYCRNVIEGNIGDYFGDQLGKSH